MIRTRNAKYSRIDVKMINFACDYRFILKTVNGVLLYKFIAVFP